MYRCLLLFFLSRVGSCIQPGNSLHCFYFVVYNRLHKSKGEPFQAVAFTPDREYSMPENCPKGRSVNFVHSVYKWNKASKSDRKLLITGSRLVIMTVVLWWVKSSSTISNLGKILMLWPSPFKEKKKPCVNEWRWSHVIGVAKLSICLFVCLLGVRLMQETVHMRLWISYMKGG